MQSACDGLHRLLQALSSQQTFPSPTIELCFVHNVAQVSTNQAWQISGQLQEVHVSSNIFVAQLEPQDLVPPLGVWLGHPDLQ
jgi:hypothetical protein